MPSISAPEAVDAAQRHFRTSSDGVVCQDEHGSTRSAVRTPSITATFPLASQPTVLSLPRTKSSPVAHLEFYNRQLVWVIRLPFRTETFLLLVAANGVDASRVVLCSPWTAGARCSGPVVGFDDARAVMTLPPPPTMFPSPLMNLPNASLLADWIEVDGTLGNNVVTHFGIPQTLVRATAGVFSSTLNARDQSLLNAFFFCNYLHDFFLLLGFGEREGNFQLKNAAGVPGGGDRLMVSLFNQTFPHLGKMDARLDGQRAEMKLGVAPSGQQVALHADVVIHEYTHGVSQRMVGGRRGAASLVLRQSLALAEGWSDYFAITLRNHHLSSPNYDFAGWAGTAQPFRSAPYNPAYSGHYGLLGRAPHDTPHGAGEIFAVALIRFNEFLGNALGATRGNCIGWRAVVESLRQCKPNNPTFLDARDALFRAITELGKNQVTSAEATAAHDAARAAFAQYGMGPNARGPASAELGPTTADRNQ
jgi:extracellular elastinolytic metalloproteinase